MRTPYNHIPDVMSEWDCRVLDMMEEEKTKELMTAKDTDGP